MHCLRITRKGLVQLIVDQSTSLCEPQRWQSSNRLFELGRLLGPSPCESLEYCLLRLRLFASFARNAKNERNSGIRAKQQRHQIPSSNVSPLETPASTPAPKRPPRSPPSLHQVCTALSLSTPCIQILATLQQRSQLPLPEQQILDRLEELARVLPVQIIERIIIQDVALLKNPPETLYSSYTTLLSELACPVESVTRLVMAIPGLLVKNPGGVVQKVKELTKEIMITDGQAVGLLKAWPDILNVRACTIRERLESLGALLGVSTQRAVKMFQAEPALLSVKHSRLEVQLEMTHTALGISRAEACRWAVDCPALLVKFPSSEAFMTHVNDLRQLASRGALGFRDDKIVLMMQARPPLVLLDLDTLESRLRGLRDVASSNDKWRSQLEGMPASALAKTVQQAKPPLLARLQYMAHVGRQDAASITTVLDAKPQDFSEQFPGYVIWAAEQRAKRNAAAAGPSSSTTSSSVASTTTSSSTSISSSTSSTSSRSISEAF